MLVPQADPMRLNFLDKASPLNLKKYGLNKIATKRIIEGALSKVPNGSLTPELDAKMKNLAESLKICSARKINN